LGASNKWFYLGIQFVADRHAHPIAYVKDADVHQLAVNKQPSGNLTNFSLPGSVLSREFIPFAIDSDRIEYGPHSTASLKNKRASKP
jgi:hypothetical protein